MINLEDLSIEELNAYAHCADRICMHQEKIAWSEKSVGDTNPLFLQQNGILMKYNKIYQTIIGEITKRLNEIEIKK